MNSTEQDTRYKRFVQDKIYSARIQAQGTKHRVVRDRLDVDGEGQTTYVFLSGVHYTSEDAWRDAAIRVGFLS